jgi:miniconductance mechanosensitive channel
MQSTGARRIKRSVLIDVNSIRFQSRDEINHFKRFALLKDYIAAKEEELTAYNEALEHEVSETVNMRRLTNIGTFRAYAESYLQNHPHIHKGMTLMVRQLGADAHGLPLEIYCFTNTTVWAEYESIQADIFDHLLAIIPEFGLRIYQQPAGSDLANLCTTRQQP